MERLPLPVDHLSCCEQECPRPSSLSIFSRRNLLKEQLTGVGEPEGEKVMKSLHGSVQVIRSFADRIAQSLLDTEGTEDPTEANQISQNLVNDLCSQYSYKDVTKKGLEWGDIYQKNGYTKALDKHFMERNKRVAHLIGCRAISGSLLDHDCGDSYVANFIQDFRPDVQVTTTDSMDVRGENTKLPFIQYNYEKKELPIKNKTFDQALMATVLHHCDQPEKMFDEVVRCVRPGGRVYIFENTFSQGGREEKALNILFDWYFNTVVHKSQLPCPFSHFCPEQWKYFIKSKGLTLEEEVHDGMYKAIPLQHTLFVARKS